MESRKDKHEQVVLYTKAKLDVHVWCVCLGHQNDKRRQGRILSGVCVWHEYECLRRDAAWQEYQPAGLFREGGLARRRRRRGRAAPRVRHVEAQLDGEQHAVRLRHDADLQRAADGDRLGSGRAVRALFPRGVPAAARVRAPDVRGEAARGVAGRRAARERDAVRVPIRPCGGLDSGVFCAAAADRDIHGALLGRDRDRAARRRRVRHSERGAVPDRVHAARRGDCVVLQPELPRAVCAVCVVLARRRVSASAAWGPRPCRLKFA